MNKAIEYIWKTIAFPESAVLGKRIPKKQFIENGEFLSNDKKIFRENLNHVYWQYTLKPSTCSILPYRDNEREYLEIAVLQVEMNSLKRHKRIAELIHRSIPYPLMLAFYDKTGCFALSIAPKRFSQTEHGAFVVERFFTTDWINQDTLNDKDNEFIKSLAWGNMPIQTYGTLYNAWIERFTGYECSEISGSFKIDETEDRLENLTQCRKIEAKILELRNQLKKEAFNRQIELNIEIKKFEQELNMTANLL